MQKIGKIFFWFAWMVIIFYMSSCSKENKELPDAKDTLVSGDTTSVHFFVVSDWGFGTDEQKSVAIQMDRVAKIIGLDFVITGGDNFYPSGVQSVDDSLWKSNFEDIYNYESLQVPWYPSLGNHDYLGNVQAQIDYSEKSKRWKMPFRYYTFIKNNGRFIIIDTEELIQEYDAGQDVKDIRQYSWLKNVLDSVHEKWIFVIGHTSIFSSSPTHGDSKQLIELIKPLLNKYKVDFYISGHDHNFEHAREAGSDIDYFVTGTAGSVRPEGHNERTVFSLSALGFTYFKFSADTVAIYFIDNGGKLRYSFKKSK